MRFDVHGRFVVEVTRTAGAWTAFIVEGGKRRLATDILIPADVRPEDIPGALDDLFHEIAQPGTTIRPLDT